MGKPRIFSGIQPTGDLHLGNYLGAIRNWVEGQSNYENFFCVVDLHAITVSHNPAALAADTYSVAALYLACGIELEYASIFVQSHVSAHSELAWLLNCITPLNWLQDMVQFKEKAIKQGENVGAGLLNYPVLMAADILLYDTDKVPVGEDQKQHLELTRDIAARLNYLYGTEEKPVLKLPEPVIRPEGARVMSLTDGTRKMSKSDPSEMSRINLLDPPDLIQQKIKRCKTDSVRGLTFDTDRPECSNLLTLYMILSNQTKEAVAQECADMGWGQFKPLFTETVVAALKPIQDKYHEIRAESGYLESVLQQGRERAEAIAKPTLAKVKAALGYSMPL
ncbi:MAG TPA: tryptophan--tRNA ligase [Coleofasciculaceae cyanobacterium]